MHHHEALLLDAIGRHASLGPGHLLPHCGVHLPLAAVDLPPVHLRLVTAVVQRTDQRVARAGARMAEGSTCGCTDACACVWAWRVA